MTLTLHRGEGVHQIRSVSAEGILINHSLYTKPLIISADTLIDEWPAHSAKQFSEELFRPVLEMNPDLLLIGTGATQVFLDQKLHCFLLAAGIGVEVMTTAAACRTFNVVMSEGRNAVAALLPIAPPENEH